MKTTIQHLIQKPIVVAVFFLLTCIAISACDTTDTDEEDVVLVEFTGDFSPAAGVIETEATGNVEATFDFDTRELFYNVEWDGLTSPVLNMFFYDDELVIHEITGWQEDTAGVVPGAVILSANEAASLVADDIYVMIHTEDYPDGEVLALLLTVNN